MVIYPLVNVATQVIDSIKILVRSCRIQAIVICSVVETCWHGVSFKEGVSEKVIGICLQYFLLPVTIHCIGVAKPGGSFVKFVEEARSVVCVSAVIHG